MMMSNTAEKIPMAIQTLTTRYSEALRRQEETAAALEVVLGTLRNTHPELVKAETAATTMTVEAKSLKEELTDLARSLQVPKFQDAGISVTYNNPMEVSYDANKLLELHPEALQIPRLITRSVDVEVMEAATAAGLISPEVRLMCKKTRELYENGRVTVKKLKGK
jgi:hypothetical protein